MKSILNLVAICMTVAIIGCSATSNTAVSPGAVSECGAKEGLACTKDKSECCGAKKCDGDKASLGAVSECSIKECSSKKECASKKSCEASLGAVSEKSCAVKCEAKKECEAKKSCETSLGAVSEKTCAVKKSCAAKRSCSKN